MSDGAMGLVVFFFIAAASALLWHTAVTNYGLAAAVATVSSVVTFQIFAYWHDGRVDPFIVVAVITSSIMAALISLLVGLPFRMLRKRRVSHGAAL